MHYIGFVVEIDFLDLEISFIIFFLFRELEREKRLIKRQVLFCLLFLFSLSISILLWAIFLPIFLPPGQASTARGRRVWEINFSEADENNSQRQL